MVIGVGSVGWPGLFVDVCPFSAGAGLPGGDVCGGCFGALTPKFFVKIQIHTELIGLWYILTRSISKITVVVNVVVNKVAGQFIYASNRDRL